MSGDQPRNLPAAGSVRYRMRQKLFSIGDDYWVTDEDGERAYKVDGKTLRLRKTLVLEDSGGEELLKIRERALSWRDAMHIEAPDGTKVATVKKAKLAPLHARWTVDIPGGEDLKVTGDILGHEYRIQRGHDTVAEVSKKWFRVADEYGIEVFSGADPTLMLAIAAVLDATAHDS